MLPTRDPKPSMIQDWEKASVSLASAISHFFELSTLLESQCTTADTTPNDLVARIDSSLSLFQTTLDGQFTQARLALAKTRNRLVVMRGRNILRLPEEILADIFLKFVYDPPEGRYLTLVHEVEVIYQHVHTLVEVCTSWRNTAIACGSLWFIIPIVDPPFAGPRALSTKLSLRRAGNRSLHLAMFKSCYSCPRHPTLVPHWSQFDSINVCSNSAEEIHEAIRSLTEHQGLGSLSKLSLHHSGVPISNDPRFNPFTRLEPQLIDLIKSLSVLRICKITIAWEAISFRVSHRLTELWMSDIVWGEMAAPGFFSALSSAPELRHLTIVNTRALLEDITIFIPSTMPFPQLKFLHLERLPFNFLDLILDFIGPGSYRLTLNPCVDIFDNYPEGWVAIEDIRAVIGKRPVHTLILQGSGGVDYFWEYGEGLHGILKCVPSLKNLIVNDFDINTSFLEACIPPSRSHTSAFPNLQVLEIYAATFFCPLNDLQKDFTKVLNHHSIQRMVLGGMVEIGEMEDATPLDADDDTVRWLKARVPQFYMMGHPRAMPGRDEQWRLWDI